MSLPLPPDDTQASSPVPDDTQASSPVPDDTQTSSPAPDDTQASSPVPDDTQTSSETIRFDQHPRFQALAKQRDEYKKEIENLQNRIKDMEDFASVPANNEENEENRLPKNSLKQELKNEFTEDRFIESIGLQNPYDAEKTLKVIRPIAQSLLQVGKAVSYQEALKKAYSFENMQEEINIKIAQGRYDKEKITGVTGSVNAGVDNISINNEQLKIAQNMGISPQEYIKYL